MHAAGQYAGADLLLGSVWTPLAGISKRRHRMPRAHVPDSIARQVRAMTRRRKVPSPRAERLTGKFAVPGQPAAGTCYGRQESFGYSSQSLLV